MTMQGKHDGLTRAQVERSAAEHGLNRLTQIPPEPLWLKLLKGFCDPMILILLVALVIQLVLFFAGKAEWYEPVGILIAILLANGVAAMSENSQENKALELKAAEEAKEAAKVVREGVLLELPAQELVVGDIVCLEAGDKIPADGLLLDGTLAVDQSTLNGETEEAPKSAWRAGMEYERRELLNPCYVYRGTVVCGGEGVLEVREVGDRTMFGELSLSAQSETRATPLQFKLQRLARQISAFGYVGAVAIVCGILCKTVWCGEGPSDAYGWVRLLVDAVTVAVTIVVCAVPEGLPMLTSILLSLQSLKMVKDNVLVRKISGLETAGSLNVLFCDKTGTLTEGRLSVAEVATGGLDVFHAFGEIPRVLREELWCGLGRNNSSKYSEGKVIGGNSTDRALMEYLHSAEDAVCGERGAIVRFQPFDSNRKNSLLTLEKDGRTLTYVKGAPEKIFERCVRYIGADGVLCPMADRREELDAYLDRQSRRSMRLLAVASGEGDGDGGLTLVGIVSIRDNVRKEVLASVREVKEAGVQVVMVTGDRRETAVAIAREAGLLTQENELALTSAELAALGDGELKALLPRLRVVARALPLDKSRLVRLAQENGCVVGMTGDGVNDSPALRKADVGFAMGSGTEVAKEAGDITILDDNFASVEKAILYGRTMFKNIRKFLVFQLTVNVAAVLVCFLGPMFGENIILTVVQLLLVNLSMDTLAAIAFGSEPAEREFLREKPVPREESIVTRGMFAEVLVSALYITAASLAILFWQPVRGLFLAGDPSHLKTAVFATFMMAIALNGFHARTRHMNPFRALGRNWNFLAVMCGIFLMQYCFVTFGGEALDVRPLGPHDWCVCLLLASLVLPLGVVRKAWLSGR